MSPVTGGAYFQHFVDRGFSKLSQVAGLLLDDPEIKIIMSPVFAQRHPIVGQMMDRMGLSDRIILFNGGLFMPRICCSHALHHTTTLTPNSEPWPCLSCHHMFLLRNVTQLCT